MTDKKKARQKAKPDGGDPPANQKDVLRYPADETKSEERRLVDVALDPAAHALTFSQSFDKGSFGTRGLTETYEAMSEKVRSAKKGDLAYCRALLVSQAISLNSVFTEMSRRSAANMGEHLQATELYMRLALKAQAQSRSTIEALDKLTNGREQTVRHVHVDNRGGQAIIAENVNQGGGKPKNEDQCYGAGIAGCGPALLGEDAQGNGVPIPSSEGTEAVPHARRDEPRRA